MEGPGRKLGKVGEMASTSKRGRGRANKAPAPPEEPAPITVPFPIHEVGITGEIGGKGHWTYATHQRKCKFSTKTKITNWPGQDEKWKELFFVQILSESADKLTCKCLFTGLGKELVQLSHRIYSTFHVSFISCLTYL